MPAPVESHGTIATIDDGGFEGTVDPDDGGPRKDFKNPVAFELEPGKGVTFLTITNPATNETTVIINGKD